MITVVLPVALLVLVGVFGAALLSPALRRAVLALIGGLLLAGSVLLAPLAALLSPLVAAVRNAVVERASPLPSPSASAFDNALSSPLPQGGSVLPPTLSIVATVLQVVILLGMAVVMWLVLRWTARQMRGSRQSTDDERTSVWSWHALRDDLRNLLSRQLPQLRQAPSGLFAALRALCGGDAATRIWRAYIRLLLLAEARGHGRAAAQTPREYVPQMEELAPQVAQQVTLLTHIYEQARYGGSPSPAQAEATEQALRDIRKNAKT